MESLGEIRVSGQVKVAMEADCDRCLEAVAFPIDSAFALYYRPVAEGYGDEKQIDTGEGEVGFYQGEGGDLNDVLRECILLTLPIQRVCSKDCRRMRPGCGDKR